jgi:hypothetical protein
VLDIGPTSSTNINYVTNLGHSIYMREPVEAQRSLSDIPGEARKSLNMMSIGSWLRT